MYNCTPPGFDMDMYLDSSTPTSSALTISTPSPMCRGEATELQWRNGDVVETLLVEPYSSVSYYRAPISAETSTAACTSSAAIQLAARNLAVPSPFGNAGAIAVPPPNLPRPMEMITNDGKRKGRETDDIELHNEDVECESAGAKTQVCPSTSSKKYRTAKVHNLAERNRRSRINEKMNALRDLIPRCNKIDKASILDDAIEYLKSLQLQVQILSKRGGMVSGMCPGGQQYTPPVGMGMNQPMMSSVGMNQPMMSNMSMNQPMMSNVGMNQPMALYCSVLPG